MESFVRSGSYSVAINSFPAKSCHLLFFHNWGISAFLFWALNIVSRPIQIENINREGNYSKKSKRPWNKQLSIWENIRPDSESKCMYLECSGDIWNHFNFNHKAIDSFVEWAPGK